MVSFFLQISFYNNEKCRKWCYVFLFRYHTHKNCKSIHNWYVKRCLVIFPVLLCSPIIYLSHLTLVLPYYGLRGMILAVPIHWVFLCSVLFEKIFSLGFQGHWPSALLFGSMLGSPCQPVLTLKGFKCSPLSQEPSPCRPWPQPPVGVTEVPTFTSGAQLSRADLSSVGQPCPGALQMDSSESVTKRNKGKEPAALWSRWSPCSEYAIPQFNKEEKEPTSNRAWPGS